MSPHEIKLTPEERDALKAVGLRIMQPVLPVAMTNRLIELRLVEQVLGGFQLTGEGELWLATHP